MREYRKYDSGAVGSFTHVAALQGTNYSCEFEVFADGYSLKSVELDTVKPCRLTLLTFQVGESICVTYPLRAQAGRRPRTHL